MQRKTPVRLTASTRSQASSSYSARRALSPPIPALLSAVQPSESLRTRTDGLSDLRGVGHVTRNEVGLAAPRAHQPHRLVPARFVDVGHHDRRSLVCEQSAVARPMPEAAPVTSETAALEQGPHPDCSAASRTSTTPDTYEACDDPR